MPQGSNAAPDAVPAVTGQPKRKKRKRLSAADREKFRQNALKHQPWRFSTGPRTPEGKRRSSQNGRYRQKNSMSRREMQRELRDVNELLAGFVELRGLIG